MCGDRGLRLGGAYPLSVLQGDAFVAPDEGAFWLHLAHIMIMTRPPTVVAGH
jgi:hypothetical protein